MKILVVEDDCTNQQVASLFLKKFGYQADIAENGEVAVEMSELNQYSLIFMDCQMPIMDGFTATKKIKNSDHLNSKTPVIALTANRVKGIEEDCKNCGMDDILYKPITLKSMSAIVEKWLT